MNPRRSQTSLADHPQRLLKPRTLRPRQSRPSHLSRSEVRHHSIDVNVLLRSQPAQQLPQLRADSHSLPRHPGIDLQMHRQRLRTAPPNRRSQPLHLLPLPHHRRQPMLHDRLGILRQQAAHDQNSGLCSICRTAAKAVRTAAPSAASVTPSHSAPARANTGAQTSAPCPYAFAFTTASTAISAPATFVSAL